EEKAPAPHSGLVFGYSRSLGDRHLSIRSFLRCSSLLLSSQINKPGLLCVVCFWLTLVHDCRVVFARINEAEDSWNRARKKPSGPSYAVCEFWDQEISVFSMLRIERGLYSSSFGLS